MAKEFKRIYTASSILKWPVLHVAESTITKPFNIYMVHDTELSKHTLVLDDVTQCNIGDKVEIVALHNNVQVVTMVNGTIIDTWEIIYNPGTTLSPTICSDTFIVGYIGGNKVWRRVTNVGTAAGLHTVKYVDFASLLGSLTVSDTMFGESTELVLMCYNRNAAEYTNIINIDNMPYGVYTIRIIMCNTTGTDISIGGSADGTITMVGAEEANVIVSPMINNKTLSIIKLPDSDTWLEIEKTGAW